MLVRANKDVVITAVGEALSELLQREREDATAELNAEVKALRVELGALQDALTELRQVVAGGVGRIIDPPKPLRRVQ